MARGVVPDLSRCTGSRCRTSYWAEHSRTELHVARGWRARPCPTCKALPGDPCRTPSGREASRTHQARLRPGRHELVSDESVWQELEARGATIATVPFTGRAGRGGRVDRIMLRRLDGDELVDVERWTEPRRALLSARSPVWDRFGSFAGQPRIAGPSVDNIRSACGDRGSTRRSALRRAHVTMLRVAPFTHGRHAASQQLMRWNADVRGDYGGSRLRRVELRQPPLTAGASLGLPGVTAAVVASFRLPERQRAACSQSIV